MGGRKALGPGAKHMAYGRLDVYWSDGKFETYPLDSPTVSVGRSSGCTIILETDTISRYHFSITQADGEIKISDMDSANGTFVDGVKLKANESRPLQGGEEIQIGHLRMIYHYADDMPTVAIEEDVAETTQRFERDDFDYKVEVYPPPIAVPPGAHTTAEVTITNTSKDDRQFTIRVDGLPKEWVRINRPSLLIRPDEVVTVLVNIKPLRHFESKPGAYQSTVTIMPKDEPDKAIVAEMTTTILPFSGFGIALATRKVDAYHPFQLHLHNQGSASLPIYVVGRSKDDALRFQIRQQNIMMAPGQRLVVHGDIKSSERRLFGKPKLYPFDLMVRSRDDAGFLVAERGQYLDSAILPRWAAAGIGLTLIGALILVAALILLIALSVTPTPQITDFETDVDAVARGDLLTVRWTASDVESYSVLVNGETVAEGLPADVNSTQISTGDYDGDIAVAIAAFNGDERDDSQPLIVRVFEPLVIEYFEAAPSTVVVRNVVQPLTIRWRVNGATTTRIEGLEGFSNSFDIEPSYGPEGTLAEIPGAPEDDFTFTLVAIGEVGNTLEQVLTFDVIDAVCTTIEDEFTLYAEPSLSSNVVSTVPVDTRLIVDRRDETGSWIRVIIDGGALAWGVRQNMACDETFNPDSLLIEVQPAPVPPAESTAESNE